MAEEVTGRGPGYERRIEIDILEAARMIAGGQPRIERQLRGFVEEGTIPHSMLFSGPEGTGKTLLAVELAARLNCESGKGVPDGRCATCGKVQKLEYPDLHLVFAVPYGEWEKALPVVIESRREDFFAYGEFGGRARSIGIDIVRKVIESVSKHPFEGRRSVVVVFEAHLMTVEAQNAILRLLEEPPGSSVLVLVTEFPDKLLETAVSRCRQLRFDFLARDIIAGFLERFLSVESDEAKRTAVLSEGNLRRAVRLLEEEYTGLRRDAAAVVKLVSAGDGKRLLAEAEGLAARYGREELKGLLEEISVVLRILMRRRIGMAGGEEEALFDEIMGGSGGAGAPARDFTADLRKIGRASNNLARNADMELTLSQLLLDLVGTWY
jgi:DNA polymerase-3 subunit delta'